MKSLRKFFKNFICGRGDWENSILNFFVLLYKTAFNNGLTENEYDHVFIGKYDSEPIINSLEVNAYKWVDVNWLKKDIENIPEIYTTWLKLCFGKLLIKLKGD